MQEQMGAEHYGAKRQETDEAKAERIVAKELERRRWEGGGIGPTRQRGCGQGGHGGSVTEADASGGPMDRTAAAHGGTRYVHQLLYQQRKGACDA